jgi:hypothetical protein
VSAEAGSRASPIISLTGVPSRGVPGAAEVLASSQAGRGRALSVPHLWPRASCIRARNRESGNRAQLSDVEGVMGSAAEEPKRTVRHLGISVIDSAPAASLVRPDLLDEPGGANSVRFCLRSSLRQPCRRWHSVEKSGFAGRTALRARQEAPEAPLGRLCRSLR